MREAAKYDYNNPVYSPATAHFTQVSFKLSSFTRKLHFAALADVFDSTYSQVVWKSTTGLACARANCPAGTVLPAASVFTVCRYSPPVSLQFETFFSLSCSVLIAFTFCSHRRAISQDSTLPTLDVASRSHHLGLVLALSRPEMSSLHASIL